MAAGVTLTIRVADMEPVQKILKCAGEMATAAADLLDVCTEDEPEARALREALANMRAAVRAQCDAA